MSDIQVTGQLNLIAAWGGILSGFLMGLGFGLFFQKESWLGGYTSFKRRLYRLGHIALFALAAINFMFYLTVRGMDNGVQIQIASIAFVVGAAFMPVCCVIMAHLPRLRFLFAIPVLSLIFAAALTIHALTTGPGTRSEGVNPPHFVVR